jgi:hypothetical protein
MLPMMKELEHDAIHLHVLTTSVLRHRAKIGKVFNCEKSVEVAGRSLGTRGSHSGGAML